MNGTLEAGLNASDFSWEKLSDDERGKVRVLYKKVSDMGSRGNMLRDTDGEKLPEHLQPGMAYNVLSLKPGLVDYVEGRTEEFNARNADAGHIRMFLKAYRV